GVYVEDTIPLGFIQVHDRGVREDAGAGDQDVHTLPRPVHLGDHVPHRGAVGDVEAERESAPAEAFDRGDRLARRVAVQVDGGHVSALTRQLQGDGPAESATSARYDRGPPL